MSLITTHNEVIIMYQLKDTVRWTEDIGMFAIDRSREDSCVHKTEACAAACFNNKLEAAFGHAIHPKDIKNDEAWYDNDAQGLAVVMKRKKRQTKRSRFMTRGETFKDADDIPRVLNIVRATPDTVWWIPTRAWRNALLWAQIQEAFADVPNVRINCSTDTDTTYDEWFMLQDERIMFFGNDEMLHTPQGRKMFKCPKTWGHVKGACAVCKRGCFDDNEHKVVHLKQH